jgi:RNA polymerase sigma-70 factor (ECF subfamily)
MRRPGGEENCNQTASSRILQVVDTIILERCWPVPPFPMPENAEIPGLVERARSDQRAFAELYDHFHDPVFNYILRRTANAELARDLTADTFLQVLRKLWTFRYRGVPFSAWLFRVASNQVNQFFRRNRNYRWLPLADGDGGDAGEAAGLGEEAREVERRLQAHADFLEVHELISTLGARYQEVVCLRYFEDKKIEEIAEILGKSTGTVKSLLHRALKQLQQRAGSAPAREEP